MSPNVTYRIRQTSHAIEQFGNRVQWMVQNLDSYPAAEKRIQTKADLWRTIVERGDVKMRVRHWKRLVSPTGTASVPDTIIQVLLQIYQDMPEEVLLTNAFSEFTKYALPITAIRKKWKRPEALSHLTHDGARRQSSANVRVR